MSRWIKVGLCGLVMAGAGSAFAQAPSTTSSPASGTMTDTGSPGMAPDGTRSAAPIDPTRTPAQRKAGVVDDATPAPKATDNGAKPTRSPSDTLRENDTSQGTSGSAASGAAPEDKARGKKAAPAESGNSDTGDSTMSR